MAAHHGHNRQALERFCRYATRPPIALERLTWRYDGCVEYAFRKPWRDGTRAVVLTPEDLLARLYEPWDKARRVFTRRVTRGGLTSNAALRAEVVPGRARENARSDVTKDTAQGELFGEEKNEAVRIAASSGMASPAGVRRGGSRVRALYRQVAPRGDCDRACGHQADHPKRATPARGARERNGSASAAARTAGSVDVRVSVRETERCCGTSQKRSGRRWGSVRPE